MKKREELIAFHLNYCCHYKGGKGSDMLCDAGQDLRKIQQVPVGKDGIKWGPCIEGHTLENPKSYCPHWERRTREEGEKYADSIERTLEIFTKVVPVIGEWRKKEPIGKREVIVCPACGGTLHLSQSAYNGHLMAQCETKDCVSFME